MSVVYDAGMLVAADRNNRKAWADHRTRLALGITPLTTAPIIAQTSRSGRQARLRQLLRGCEILPFAPDYAHDVGALLGRSRTSDVVDAHLVLVAAGRGAIVITSDADDINHLAAHLPHPIAVVLV